MVRLDAVPPGINQDEATHAYDAYCLLKTGKDHGGEAWPIFVHGNGARERRSAPYMYLLIPFQALLGISPFSSRLPGALLGTLTVGLLHWVVRPLWGVRAGMWSAALLAVSPWHIHLSRLAFEISICPFLLTLAVFLFERGVLSSSGEGAFISTGRVANIAASGCVLGLASWTYHSMRLFVPLLLVGGLLLFFGDVREFERRKGGRLGIAGFVAGLLIGVSPFLWACVKTPQIAWGRAGAEFVLNRAASIGEAGGISARSYALQLSPSFLFISGDPSPIQSLPGHGQLYWICAPLLLLGLARVVRRRRLEPAGRFLLYWLIVAPIPAALTHLDAGHSLRAATALPAYQVLSGLGADLAIAWAANRGKAGTRIAATAIAAALASSAARFGHLFFGAYPVNAARDFHQEFRPVVEEIERRKAEYDLVLLTSRDCGQNGRLYLFWSGLAPEEYFAQPRNVWNGPEWDVILQVGNVFFVQYESLEQLIPQLPADMRRPHVLVAERPGVPVPGTVLKRFDRPDGTAAMVLYDLYVERPGK
jgi:hypothetical protein